LESARALISNLELGRVEPNAEDIDRFSRLFGRKISWLANAADPDENEEPPSPYGAILDVVSIYSADPKALHRLLYRLRIACAEEED
jgi:transcriptional regulator with XRE-family HTH domain